MARIETNANDLIPNSLGVEEVFINNEAAESIPPKILEQGMLTMSQYLNDATDPDIRRRVVSKILHMGDTITATLDIASRTPEVSWNIPQALTIGFLHDIGRLPQAYIGEHWQQNKNIGSRGHGQEGAEIVGGFDFSDTGVDKETVVNAIAHHDLAEADRDKPYILLVRDADRLALYRHLENSKFFINRIVTETNIPISPTVQRELLEGEMVINNHVNTVSDELVRMLAWIPSMTYPATLMLIRNEQLIDVIENQLKLATGGLDPLIQSYINGLK